MKTITIIGTDMHGNEIVEQIPYLEHKGLNRFKWFRHIFRKRAKLIVGIDLATGRDTTSYG
jgi:hypothetical protein